MTSENLKLIILVSHSHNSQLQFVHSKTEEESIFLGPYFFNIMDITPQHLLPMKWERNVSQLPTSALQASILGTTITLTILCSLVFAMRMYGRILTKQVGLGMWLDQSVSPRRSITNDDKTDASLTSI